MKSRILRFVFALVLFFIGYMLGHRSTAVVHAQVVNHVNIPMAWGQVIGVTPDVLVFQDSGGTIRLATASTGKLGEVVTRN